MTLSVTVFRRFRRRRRLGSLGRRAGSVRLATLRSFLPTVTDGALGRWVVRWQRLRRDTAIGFLAPVPLLTRWARFTVGGS